MMASQLLTLSESATAIAPMSTHPLESLRDPLSQAINGSVHHEAASSTWLGLFGSLLLAIFKFIPSMLYWLIAFVTMTLPSWLFRFFSMSLTFTLNATTLMFILAGLLSTLIWLVRYRYLNVYTRLPPEPQRKEPQVELFPDTQEGTKPGLSNYLDEFLSAIKVFGYLERAVFHELTRTMQTRKLIAGETLNLEEEKGFCLVVDGMVEIFVKSARDNGESDSDGESRHGQDDYRRSSYSDDDGQQGTRQQGYQLLTEVKNGAPMSSLFSILSLFTEDINLRHADDDEPESNTSNAGLGNNRSTPDSELSQDIPPSFPASPTYEMDNFAGQPRETLYSPSTKETVSGRGRNLSNIPPMSLDASATTNRRRSKVRRPKSSSAHPDIVARATVDTTIAIIPASAFHRLTRVYPKSTAHIVQVIMARLQRVTLATGHSYLGLTSEVLRTEKHMNRYTTYELPNFLRGDALGRLKEKFAKEKERAGEEESKKGIALHNPGAGRRRTSSSSLSREAAIRGLQRKGSVPMRSPPAADSGAVPSPGDLLTNIHMSRSLGRKNSPFSNRSSNNQVGQGQEVWHHDTQSPLAQKSFNPLASPRHTTQLQRQDSVDEDSIFRASILECIFKAIGLNNARKVPPSESVEASPRLVSYDQRKQKAVFTNAFGLIDPYEASIDADSESITSNGTGITGFSTIQGLGAELKDELEIVYFPQGSVLVEQGERNPGLYYVIDGFLDVSVPVDEKKEVPVFGQNERSFTSKAFDLDERLAPLGRTMTGSSRTSGAGKSTGAEPKKRRSFGRKSIALIKPGGIAGYVGAISSYRSFIDVTAKTNVYVGFLPRTSLERIVEKYPVVLLTMAKRLTSLLPSLILHIDFALEWVQVNAGQVIYHQGDDSDAIYIVLNGRLRAVSNHDDLSAMEVVGEYGQGESVGELEVMTESARPATLHAIRDTELAKFPRTLFNSLAQEHPGITIKISKIIASRMRSLVDNPVFTQRREKTTAATSSQVSSTMNLRTVAIVPITAGVPVVEFGSRLLNALTQIGAPNGVTSLVHAAILNHLGRHAFSRMGKLKLSQYLADLEEKYGLVLYIAGT